MTISTIFSGSAARQLTLAHYLKIIINGFDVDEISEKVCQFEYWRFFNQNYIGGKDIYIYDEVCGKSSVLKRVGSNWRLAINLSYILTIFISWTTHIFILLN